MPTQIITKNSASASSVPTTGDLTTQGEMAVNVVDKRLFVRDNASAIQEVGTNPSSLTCSGTANFTATFQLGGVAVTSTAAELNKLDGTTAVTADFDKLAAVTASAAELNYVDGVTSAIQTQLDSKVGSNNNTFTGTTNISGTFQLGGTTVTADAGEINKLDGVTASTAELNYVDVTTAGTVQASKAVTADASGNINFNNGDMTNVDINSGAIDGTAIGANSHTTGKFTTLEATTSITQAGSTLDATYLPRNSLTEVITGSSDTLTAAEEGYDLIYTNGTNCTVTTFDTAAVGFQCTLTRAGAGSLNIQRGGTDTLNGGTAALAVQEQWDTVWLIHYEEGKWLVAGNVA